MYTGRTLQPRNQKQRARVEKKTARNRTTRRILFRLLSETQTGRVGFAFGQPDDQLWEKKR